MSTVQFFRNLTYEFETLRWWLYMRSTVTGPGILGRGVWKFAMAYIRDYDDLGFHVFEDDSAEWAIVPEYDTDFRSLRPNDDDVISENIRWW